MNEQLKRNNYIVIPNFISSQKAQQLADKFKDYCSTHELKVDPQVPNCNAAKFDFIPFVELLVEKSTTVTQLVGETVLPTYSYARIYTHGNVLPDHVDKPECEISLTVNLECDQIWDIHIETPSGKVDTVKLQPGDAMLYLGMVGMHGRCPFEGTSCTQVFLHYVRSMGEHFRCYFDKDHRYKDDLIKKTPIVNASPKSENPVSKYIKVYDNVLTKEQCEYVLNEYKVASEWSDAQVSKGTTNKNVRNCDIISISTPSILEVNQNRKKIDNILFKAVDEVAKRYIKDFPDCFLESDSGYDLLRYQTNGFYTQHTDNFKSQPRTLSLSLTLNDDYLGGNIAFFDKEIQIATNAGCAVVFPSNFMYPHEILPVEKGIRYSIVTWFT